MATCHGVIQCKLEVDIIEHNDEKDAFEEIWVFYCLEYFHAFVQSEREILYRINSEKTYISLTSLSKLHENTARYDYLIEKSNFSSKCLPSSFAIVA